MEMNRFLMALSRSCASRVGGPGGSFCFSSFCFFLTAMAPKTSQRQYFTLTLLFFALGLMSVTVGVQTPIPVLTIKSPDGDVIECIAIHEQPALQHPSLQNHKLQEIPSDVVHKEEGFGWQVWHASGTACPEGSVPIRKFAAETAHYKKYERVGPNAASDRATIGYQYAIAYVIQPPIYGTRATINVWDPVVESPDDFSLAQIWVASGEYNTNDLNTIEAGWQVSRSRYGDNQPRLFTYWTKDAYLTTGCYSFHCGGFVQISRTIALEAAITRTSAFGGDQFDITIQIWKDRYSGNWWLGMGANVVPVGYWPANIFTTLSDHATMVHWGGEVLYRNSSGRSTIAQMGSGEFAEKGFRNAAYFCNLKVAEENGTFLPVQEFQLKEDHPDSYTIRKSFTRGCGNHFYYGGPGPGPVRSTAVPRELASSFFFLFLAFFLAV